jgi:dihydropyrimidinase/allantoinase
VIPYLGVRAADVGVRNGRIAAIGDDLPTAAADRIIDAAGRAVLPGAVDSHYHVGIYRPHSADAETESRSSLVGGVTTVLSYFRTGHNYLNATGPYRRIFPQVLALSDGHFYTDYGYHLAIMTAEQLDEIEVLVDESGVSSFKYYMFYKSLDLAGNSATGPAYAMTENYDLGHLYLMMERIARVAAGRGAAGRVALSLHCENPELIRVFMDRVRAEGARGLEAYSRARPPLTERLSIHEAAILADATRCPVNLLHLSSREALAAAVEVRARYPELDVVCEVTLHHLVLSHDRVTGVRGKVNPPIRARDDCEALWRGIVRGQVNTVVSDHACCLEEMKDESDLWGSLPGFGGSSLVYPVLVSEGYHRRRLPLTRVAELASANPARHFGLYPRKGTIAVGSDADLAIIDLDRTACVSPDMLRSAQEFTPFEGIELRGWPAMTVLRGEVQFADGQVCGTPIGRYLSRPIPADG